MNPALLVDGLAVYRLTRLVTRDELTRPLREKYLEPLLTEEVTTQAGPYRDELTREEPRTDLVARLAYLATCPWCLSIWTAAAAHTARRLIPDRWEPVAQVLAAAAVAGALLDRDRS